MAVEGTELILEDLGMCREVLAFWEIKVRRIDTGKLFFRKTSFVFQTVISIYRIEKNGHWERYS